MAPRTAKQFEEIRRIKRKAILDAALHVFAEEGFHSATISQIAKKAAISKGLMYNYFESKEALLKALLLNVFDDIMNIFDFENTTELTREDFIYLLDKNIEIVLNDTQFWRLYFAIIAQPDVTAIVMDQMLEKAEPYMRLFVGYFAKKGHADPLSMMRYFAAVIDGVQMHIMLDPENFPVKKVKKMIIDQFA